MKPSPPLTACILGMHRSGTSTLTGCLEARGLYLGDVVNSAPHNRKGNKENIPLRDINDAVLAFNRGSWDNPPANLAWNDELRQRRDQHISGYNGKGIWGFKDPRTILTLPFWQEALPDMSLMGTFRRPEIVVMSLLARPGMAPMTPALELWKIYNRKLLAYAENYDLPLVCFDWPQSGFLNAVDNIAINLGLCPADQAKDEFYDESLRHRGVYDPNCAHTDAQAEKIYAALMGIAVDLTPEKPDMIQGVTT